MSEFKTTLEKEIEEILELNDAGCGCCGNFDREGALKDIMELIKATETKNENS